jgi:hypothetical protein
MVHQKSPWWWIGLHCRLQDPDILKVKKVDFVAFIAMVINALPKVERRSRKIEIIVDFLNFQSAINSTEEEYVRVASSRSALERGISSDSLTNSFYS